MPDTFAVRKQIGDIVDEFLDSTLPHKFRNTKTTPGWCVYCGCHEWHILHTETQQKRII